jgi:hypothetical protein
LCLIIYLGGEKKMKKVLTAMFASSLVFGLFVGTVSAEVNAVTPSTNDINRTNGWAHVDQISQDIGTTDLQFISTRGFWSCFEYRTDGDASQVISENGGVNYNTNVTDGLYPYYCQNNNNRTETIPADEYVEVRMVFGAETDERFDWTRFDVEQAPFVRSAEITSPVEAEVVSSVVSFDSTLNDEDGNDDVQWAVRRGTCAANTNTVLGNVDGFSSAFTWDHVSFHAAANTSSWLPGGYCFIFNPTESSGDTAIRETREFVVADQIAPLVTIDAPHDGDTASGVVEIRGTALDETELSHYNIAIYNASDDVNDFSKRIDQETVYGTPGFTDEEIFEWDTTNGLYPNGGYQIRLAARDAAGNRDLSDPENGGTSSVHVIEVTVMNPPKHMNQCRKMGWKEFFNPEFKNQGDCVSWVQSNENAKGNKKDN